MGLPQSALANDEYLHSAQQQKQEKLLKVRQEIHTTILDNTDHQVLQNLDEQSLMERIRALASEIAQKHNLAFTANIRERLYQAVRAELRGYGPIQELLDDPSISEVMVNGPHQVYIEREGKLQATDTQFDDDAHVRRIIEKVHTELDDAGIPRGDDLSYGERIRNIKRDSGS